MAMKMAVVSMEMPSGGNSPTRRRAGTETSIPRTWLRDGGGCVTFLVPWLLFLGFSHLGDFIGGRAASVGHQGALTTRWRGQEWAHAQVWCGGPLAHLRIPFGLLEPSVKYKIVGFCFVQFREYLLCKISETKNSRKQELALRHLINR